MTPAQARRGTRIDPRILDRRVEVTRTRGRRRLRVLAGAFLISCVAGSGWALLHSSLLSARHVRVVGAHHTPVSTILSVSGLARHPPLFDVDPGSISARLASLPWIYEAKVLRRWPDSVSVIVRERVAVASVPDARTFAVLDATGMVLGHAVRPPAGTVPLVVSPPLALGPPGSTVAPRAAGGLAVARQLPASLRERVQAVDVGAGGAITLDLKGSVRAQFGPATELSDKFEALASVLDGVSIVGPVQIDLTVPDEPTVEPQPA